MCDSRPSTLAMVPSYLIAGAPIAGSDICMFMVQLVVLNFFLVFGFDKRPRFTYYCYKVDPLSLYTIRERRHRLRQRSFQRRYQNDSGGT